MAIFGVGAHWDGRDKTSDFIHHNVAAIGRDQKDAPGLHQIMRHMKAGDIAYLKSIYLRKSRLIVKAIGIILDEETLVTTDLLFLPGANLARNVGYIWEGSEDLPIPKDSEPVKSFTIYEEHNLVIQSRILELIFSNCHFSHVGALKALEKLNRNAQPILSGERTDEQKPF
ncbi:MAG: hypothetical protein ACLPVO_15565 [Desulfomonilaceae bacterium]